MTITQPTRLAPVAPAAPTVPLIARHVRFTLRADSPIHLQEYSGSALRGALATALRATFCPQGRADQQDPLHQHFCPVCRLLSLENDGSINGDIRRPYALEPLPAEPTTLAAGQSFRFGLAVYGDDPVLLQFLLLTVGGMGALGLGRKQADGRRGRFTVIAIEAVNPLDDTTQVLMGPDERLVRDQWLPVTDTQINAAAARLAAELAAHDNRLQVDFLTPTRVMQNQHKWSRPDFFALCKLTVQRVLDLSTQFGDGRPTLQGEPVELKRDLYPFADQVQLVQDETRWWDVKGFSSRVEREQVLGGLVGRAVYYAPDWRPLLPWLLWGVSTHVGKNAVKGCGMIRLRPNQA
ncbi:MAG: CRISPR system precrRNA processing endoribonuclease RAMP protein Cas6 [Caldilineaceae bacterium]